jgi:transposase
MAIKVIGIDIAKSVFQMRGVDEAGQVVSRRRLRRAEVLKLFAGIEPAPVGIEACHTAHYWAREIAALGHQVRLMPPQFVKPYIKAQRMMRPMRRRFARQYSGRRCNLCWSKVLNSRRRCSSTRDLLVRQRSSLISAMLAHFAEFGIVIHRRVRDIDRLLWMLGGISTLCCSGLLVGTNRMLALVTASQIASASATSFFCRLT